MSSLEYFKESFVLFEPKDIISGDFFWITTRNDKIIFATGDCTGHGVPGGFMSMLGVSLLNEIINEHDLTEPALILSRLRKKVITALRQKGLSGEQQDGMDMTICVIDKHRNDFTLRCCKSCFLYSKKTCIWI
jgi:sigma-B regulation protein RsbU (phosphoserine phosphatase)